MTTCGCCFCFWPHCIVCKRVFWLGTEPVSPAVEVQSLNPWTAREVPMVLFNWEKYLFSLRDFHLYSRLGRCLCCQSNSLLTNECSWVLELVSFGLAHLGFHSQPAEWLFKWRTGWFFRLPCAWEVLCRAQKRGSLLTKEIEAWVQFHLKASRIQVFLLAHPEVGWHQSKGVLCTWEVILRDLHCFSVSKHLDRSLFSSYLRKISKSCAGKKEV